MVAAGATAFSVGVWRLYLFINKLIDRRIDPIKQKTNDLSKEIEDLKARVGAFERTDFIIRELAEIKKKMRN